MSLFPRFFLSGLLGLFLLFSGLGNVAGSGWADAPSWLNDPYFFPDTATGPGYPGQWHLKNLAPLSPHNVGLDANLAGAWAQGWTGRGVVIGILDEAVTHHPDLDPNFVNEYSWDFERGTEQFGQDRRAQAGWFESHGTAVAGVAAARGGNGIGGTGAAPEAGIAGLRILGFWAESEQSNLNEAAAILYQGGADPFTVDPRWSDPGWRPPVRIKNHSYGFAVGYLSRDPIIADALRTSSAHRVIHLFSAGNRRVNAEWESFPGPTGDSNKDQARTLPEALVVAALGSDGEYAWYSSYGANVFVTAPSDDGSDNLSIATTDLVAEEGYNELISPDPYFTEDLDYTSAFGGTSSATPLVAGILALGMEANPDLDHRMAKHLLVRTSRMVDPGDTSSTGGWITNGAGHRFNNNYGFGLIDAGAFTELATRVAGMSELALHEGETVAVGEAFSDDVRSLERTYYVEESLASPLPLEFVQVHLTLSGLQIDLDAYLGNDGLPGIGAIAGDFEAWLTSPMGTRNQLFYHDRPLAGFADDRRTHDLETLDWTFISYAYWGENLAGDWTLELHNVSTNPLTHLGGVWDSYSFRFGSGEIHLVPELSAEWFLLVGAALFLLRRHGGRVVRFRQRRRPPTAA